jgi:hypothetical protein
MAENTITAIVPDIYEALDVVSRELTGMIPAVTMAASAERAGKDQNIVVPIAPTGNVSDNTPAMVVPDPTGQTIGSTTVQITKDRSAEFGFIGSDQKKMNTGPGYMSVRANVIAQAIRAVVNEVETDLAALQSTFSGAYGTAGTTPFGTANDYTDASNVLRMLKDRGGNVDPQLVLDTVAGANFLGKQSAVNAAGTDSMLRQGVLLDLAGMPLRESGKIKQAVTAGTGASATTDNAGYAIGATVITLASAGTGTLIVGDLVAITGDATGKYLITSGDADVSGGGTFTIAAPGLMKAIPASATAITVSAASTRNLCFARSALVLAARAPSLPEEGDMAEDRMIITDPRSGLSMEFAMYKGYKKVRYEVGLAWGVKNVKPAHTAILLG